MVKVNFPFQSMKMFVLFSLSLIDDPCSMMMAINDDDNLFLLNFSFLAEKNLHNQCVRVCVLLSDEAMLENSLV